MKGKSNFESYTGVPGGSRLEIKIEGNPAEFDGFAEVTDGENVARIKESQLLAGFTSPPLTLCLPESSSGWLVGSIALTDSVSLQSGRRFGFSIASTANDMLGKSSRPALSLLSSGRKLMDAQTKMQSVEIDSST